MKSKMPLGFSLLLLLSSRSLDYRNLNLEQWLFRELPSQLAGEGQLVTYPLPFEFRAIEALLQYRVSLCLSSFLNVS